MIRNPYKLLGLDINNPNLNKKEITKRFYSLALEIHPDKGGDVNEMKLLQAAYSYIMREVEFLSSPDDNTIAQTQSKFTTFIEEQGKEINIKSFDDVFKEYIELNKQKEDDIVWDQYIDIDLVKKYEEQKLKDEEKLPTDILPTYNPDDVDILPSDEKEDIKKEEKGETKEKDIKKEEKVIKKKEERKEKEESDNNTSDLIIYDSSATYRTGGLGLTDLRSAYKKPAFIDLSKVKIPTEPLDVLLAAKIAEREALTTTMSKDVQIEETLFEKIKHIVKKLM